VAFALILVLLALAPFAAALEIHHALAEADHDGHAHSDFDLCQWVQLHSASSIDLGAPDMEALAPPKEHDPPVQATVRSATLSAATPSRAPPTI
jgi:hypothetical protein